MYSIYSNLIAFLLYFLQQTILPMTETQGVHICLCCHPKWRIMCPEYPEETVKNTKQIVAHLCNQKGGCLGSLKNDVIRHANGKTRK